MDNLIIPEVKAEEISPAYGFVAFDHCFKCTKCGLFTLVEPAAIHTVTCCDHCGAAHMVKLG